MAKPKGPKNLQSRAKPRGTFIVHQERMEQALELHTSGVPKHRLAGELERKFKIPPATAHRLKNELYSDFLPIIYPRVQMQAALASRIARAEAHYQRVTKAYADHPWDEPPAHLIKELRESEKWLGELTGCLSNQQIWAERKALEEKRDAERSGERAALRRQLAEMSEDELRDELKRQLDGAEPKEE